jgi:hypothetical protein
MDSAKFAAGGILSFIAGPGFIPQILLTIVFFIALQVVLSIIQIIVDTTKNVAKQVTVLQANTVNGPYTVAQDPKLSRQIFNSNNELNGMENSYSAYIFISPETFDNASSTTDSCGNTDTITGSNLKHIFHKGSKAIFPLMSPGIFVNGKNNTIRVYMNSSTAWDNYVEVPNVPVNKWFHLVVMMKGKFLDVYLNGNVVARKPFNTVPKLNSGDVYIMSSRKFPMAGSSVQTDFSVSGPMKGMVSRVNYYSFALNYSQLDDIYREGPSTTVVNPSPGISNNRPPYLRDDWWVTRY